MTKTIAIAGLGWLGQTFANRLDILGYTVKGSVTSLEKAKKMNAGGIETYPLEISEVGISGEFDALAKNADYLVIMIPPGIRNNTGSNFVLKMTHLIEKIKTSEVKKVILISSTGVYDDSQGIVTESVLPKPQNNSGKQLLEVEQLFFNASEFKTTIVRFGGLFGGSRNPVRYLAGRKDLRDGNAPVNLINRKDCLAILLEIIRRDAIGHIFNAVNPDHPTKSEYYIEQAKQFSLEPPTFMAASEEEVFKQVDSENISNILGYSFKAGLL